MSERRSLLHRPTACACTFAVALHLGGVTLAAETATPTLEIEYGGCRGTTQAGACILDSPNELRLWIRTDVDARLSVERGGEPVALEAIASVQGGSRYNISAHPGNRRVDVRVQSGGASRTWSLELAPDPRSEAQRDAWAAFNRGDLDAARELLAGVDTQEAEAAGLLGRIQYVSGETQAARATLLGAMDADLAAGRELTALKEATVLAYSLTLKERRFTEARAVLDRFASRANAPAEQRYYLAYYRGLLAFNSGDDRGTLRELGAAADQAARMGWDRLGLTAEQTLAVELQMLGRRADATALLERWTERLDVLASDCDRGMFLNNVGWTRLLALEAGEQAADPLPELEHAYAIFSSPATGGLCNVDEQVNGLLNLALAHLHADRADLAALDLERAHRLTETPELRSVLWSLDIEARLALLRGHADEALVTAERLRALALATVSPDAAWRALVRKALAYEQLGRDEDALAAYVQAERQLDERLYRVPMNEGRETLVAANASATQRHVALLLAAERPREAYDVARASVSRAVRTLRPAQRVQSLAGAERARWDDAMTRYLALREEITSLAQLGWTMPREELEQLAGLRARRERELAAILDDALAVLGPANHDGGDRAEPGTLEVAFQRVPSGWVTFAASADDVHAFARSCAPAALATCLIEPIVPLIKDAQRVRVITNDELRAVDFQAVEIGGAPLLERVPVVYGLELASPPTSSTPSAPRRALLVGDAQGNLPAAQDEVRTVRDALEGSGVWSTASLTGASAGLERVRRDMSGVELFHYAGHARLLGSRGWDSELQLGGHTALDVADILALERAPTFVVLSGCETAATDAAAEAAGIGLAQAFIVSGSAGVVATTRPVRDTAALAVMREFYAAWLGGAPAERALQRAQLALRSAQPDADWAAFRFIEP
jgi:tetratricopeptide (TPR) repeat protein